MKSVGNLWAKLTVLSFITLFFIACTKFDTTRLGGDLIPVVDNINTFDTYLKVISNNYIPEDSTRLNASNEHVVGGITNDPAFGSSTATMFFQMKPFVYPFQFDIRDSIVDLDSAVLVLKYQGYYGDSNYAMNLRLYEADRVILRDTAASPSYSLQPNLGINRSKLWGEKTMAAKQFKDTIKLYSSNTLIGNAVNELRIPLNSELARSLFFQDTANNGAFWSDSLFNIYLPGFALEAQGNAQALFYFSLGEGSEMEFYYRKKVIAGFDTLVRNLTFTGGSGHAVKFDRQRNGAAVMNNLVQNPENGVPEIYIESTPGTMASIRIPGIDTLSNMIIHRAELRVTQLTPTPVSFSQLEAPIGLYLDAEEISEPGIFRGIPYDLSPFTPYFCYPGGGIDFNVFGGFRGTKMVDGNQLNEYIFNITRHIQSVVSRNEPIFNFRLSAPFYVEYRDCINGNPAYPPTVFPFQVSNNFINRIGQGRVVVAGGSHPDPRLRMQMRIIYSRI